MGIRIHKMVGYGLADLKTKGHDIVDERINSKLLRDEEFYDRIDSFPDWLKNNIEMVKYYLHSVYRVYPKKTDYFVISHYLSSLEKNKEEFGGTLFCHQSEFGDPKVMIFIPMEYAEGWYRYDNTLDWIEETYTSSQENRVINLFERGSTGIYPHNSRIILNPFRESLIKKDDGTFRTYMAGGDYNQLIGKWNKNVKPIIKDEVILNHLKNDWLPDIPASVAALAMRLGIFSKPEYLYDLRPLLYVCWK